MAFTFQSFLVQTHIHNLPQTFTAGAGIAGVTASRDAKAPLDADKCFLCQEYLHSGAYLTPAAVAALPPTAAASLLPLLLAPLHAARLLSHNWKGRAPPRA
jgi:hypothetical protein